MMRHLQDVTVRLACVCGYDDVQALALPGVPGLAIHAEGKQFVVTHRASGRALPPRFRRMDRAMAFVLAAGDEADWRQSGDAMQLIPGLAKWCERYQRSTLYRMARQREEGT